MKKSFCILVVSIPVSMTPGFTELTRTPKLATLTKIFGIFKTLSSARRLQHTQSYANYYFWDVILCVKCHTICETS